MRPCRRLLVFLLFTQLSGVIAHELGGPRNVTELDWPLDHIARTISAGYPDSFGLYAFINRQAPSMQTIAGRQCITASFLAFDVEDSYAHDIDETVSLELLVDEENGAAIFYGYDRNAEAETVRELPAAGDSDARFRKVVLELDRARFANRGMAGTDIALVARGTFLPQHDDDPSTFTLCAAKISRSHTTPATAATGKIQIRFLDQSTKASLPVRLGIYDKSGRSILPGKDAISVKYYDDNVRNLKLAGDASSEQGWPHENRYFFYTDGNYRNILPVGEYVLVAARGPEFNISKLDFRIEENATIDLSVELTRWHNMPAQNWYSGDAHIHIRRSSEDNPAISTFLQAEDIHVSNVLEMNSIAEGHFQQYAWGRAGQFGDDTYSIVPGIEAPRTAVRGHVLNLNIKKPIYRQDEYFLYHRFFEEYARQGAISGYAHVGSEEFYASRGLALDVPFALVDFVEILQAGSLRTELWYDYLNLGYHIAPIAGSDFPYFDQPGAVRSYAKINTAFSTQAWFDAIKKGETFVTSGPMLEFSVNGHAMGSNLRLNGDTHVKVEAVARMNPDIDKLQKLELVMCGEVIETVTVNDVDGTSISFSKKVPVSGSMWLAIRANGNLHGVAHSAPVYIDAGDGHSWCVEKVAATVEKVQNSLSMLRAAPALLQRELEYWEISDLQGLYALQLPRLHRRIDEANLKYDTLLENLKSSMPGN